MGRGLRRLGLSDAPLGMSLRALGAPGVRFGLLGLCDQRLGLFASREVRRPLSCGAVGFDCGCGIVLCLLTSGGGGGALLVVFLLEPRSERGLCRFDGENSSADSERANDLEPREAVPRIMAVAADAARCQRWSYERPA
jgi:hypothetical protein